MTAGKQVKRATLVVIGGVVLLIGVAVIFLVVSRFIPLDRVLGQK